MRPLPPDFDAAAKMRDFDALPPAWRALARDYDEGAVVALIKQGIRDPVECRRHLEEIARKKPLEKFE